MRHALTAALVSAALMLACDRPTEPPQPAAIAPHTTLEQSAVVAVAVAMAPAVRITSASGRPVPGVEVVFAPQGGGAVVGAVARTDAAGVAAVTSWTMSMSAGVHELVATTTAIAGAEVRFRALAAAGEPRRLGVLTQPPAVITSGAVVSPAPEVRLLDEYGNAAAVPGVIITAAVTGGALVSNATAATDTAGIATFDGLAISGAPGVYTLNFSAPSLATAFANNQITVIAATGEECAPAPLSMPLGGMARYTLDSGSAPRCLHFNAEVNTGQQFLLMFENVPLHGGYETGVFPGTLGDTTFQLTLRSRPPFVSPALRTALRSYHVTAAAEASHAWDFGAGPIYEYEPPFPAAGVPDPQLIREGRLMNLRSAADPQVGDTVVVRLEGISRLNIQTGNQKAVIRYVSPELVIAEDVRLTTTLARQGGGFNTPLSATDLADIAREYAAISRVQGDVIFDGRFNTAIEASTPRRVLAVHSLMGSDGIWGYTYSTGDYFVWDYWVGTDGATRGLNQHPQRIADNLFMHEIAHMRHWGLLQRNGAPPRGNRWLVEGFARHTERFSVANRLLGTVAPSRTGNLVLPRNPAFGTSYFRDDVPTFLNGGTSMFGGYQHSSFVFDYFMDQVALGGGNHVAALRDLVINAGNRSTADAAVSRWLPGMSFAELFTRARIALYLDDIGTVGLPAWTQYHQYQLRVSRPAGSAAALDPRAVWPRLTPGSLTELQIAVGNGAAYGVIVDGTQTSAGSGIITLDIPRATANAVLSVTRIR